MTNRQKYCGCGIPTTDKSPLCFVCKDLKVSEIKQRWIEIGLAQFPTYKKDAVNFDEEELIDNLRVDWKEYLIWAVGPVLLLTLVVVAIYSFL